MKLHPRDILLGHDRRISDAVVSITQYDSVIGWFTIEGMHEVEKSFIGNSFSTRRPRSNRYSESSSSNSNSFWHPLE